VTQPQIHTTTAEHVTVAADDRLLHLTTSRTFSHRESRHFGNNKIKNIPSNYVAAKAIYIRLLHGKMGFLGGFSALAPYTGVGPK